MIESVLPGPAITGQSTRHISLDEMLSRLSSDFYPVVMDQVHGGDVVVIDGPITDGAAPGCDAIVSNDPKALLTVRTADCLPVLVWHPSGAKAAIHAGRKSTEQGILERTLLTMTDLGYESDFMIWFGPRLCVSCHQIDRDNDFYYDLNAQNEAQIRRVVSESDYQLFQFPFCTKCRSDIFFSYRNDGPGSGRIFSFIL
jgi:hypothetical protein